MGILATSPRKKNWIHDVSRRNLIESYEGFWLTKKANFANISGNCRRISCAWASCVNIWTHEIWNKKA